MRQGKVAAGAPLHEIKVPCMLACVYVNIIVPSTWLPVGVGCLLGRKSIPRHVMSRVGQESSGIAPDSGQHAMMCLFNISCRLGATGAVL